MKSITFNKPIDYHLHLREGQLLQAVLPCSANFFSGGIIMPNLKKPIFTNKQAYIYRQEILNLVNNFSPFMTAYLTDETCYKDLIEGFNNGIFVGAKLYLQGTTTNSTYGVSDVKLIYPVLSAMEKAGMPLLIHGEVFNKEVDIFDRESVFIDTILTVLIKDFPNLRIVLEHITTKNAVDFILSSAQHIVATVTPHHLVLDRNDLFLNSKLHPHHYCLPIVKKRFHKEYLRQAVTSGSFKFIPGTDSAPHLRSAKESACGCAGIFNTSIAIPLYIMVFEECNALDRLSFFLNDSGYMFYKLDVSKKSCTFIKKPFTQLSDLFVGKDLVHQFFYPCSWRAIN